MQKEERRRKEAPLQKSLNGVRLRSGPRGAGVSRISMGRGEGRSYRIGKSDSPAT